MIPINQFIEYNYELCNSVKQMKEQLIEYKIHVDDKNQTFDNLFVYEDLYYITIYKLLYKEYKNKSNE